MKILLKIQGIKANYKIRTLPILESQTYEYISETLISNNSLKHRINENVIKNSFMAIRRVSENIAESKN